MRLQQSSTSSLAELDCLLWKEQSSYKFNAKALFPPHLQPASSSSIHWRHRICEWCYEFIDHYNFDREVVGVAMNYFDRYLSSQRSCDVTHSKDDYQTIAVTSLFIAIKVHSMSEDCLAQNRSHALSRLLYDNADPQEIYEMEMDILQALDWRLNPPTLHQFAINFSQLHPLKDSSSTLMSYLYEATRYQVELAIFSPELLAAFLPSVIAYAALKNTEEKIAADHRHILTADMRQSFKALMEDLEVDPTAVARCQLSLQRLCPQFPDLDDFNETDVDTNTRVVIDDNPQAQGEDTVTVVSISPMNVADY